MNLAEVICGEKSGNLAPIQEVHAEPSYVGEVGGGGHACSSSKSRFRRIGKKRESFQERGADMGKGGVVALKVGKSPKLNGLSFISCMSQT